MGNESNSRIRIASIKATEKWMKLNEFHPIPGFPKYAINRIGVVKRVGFKTCDNSQKRKDRKKYVEEYICAIRVRGEYLAVNTRRDGHDETRLVHRLLAETFIPNPENKPCVNHINGNKFDNRLENLEWVTYSENNVHAVDTGLMASGSKHRWAKLNESDVKEIFQLSKAGIPGRQIAKKFGVYKNTIYHILNGKNWKRLQAV